MFADEFESLGRIANLRLVQLQSITLIFSICDGQHDPVALAVYICTAERFSVNLCDLLGLLRVHNLRRNVV